MKGPSDSIRHELVVLARRKQARSTDFTRGRPTDWRPSSVRNPSGELDSYFKRDTAWEFIATLIEGGHPIETVELKKPRGAKGYVMIVDLEPGRRPLYIKLQLGSGKIIGRSFHYSKQENDGTIR